MPRAISHSRSNLVAVAMEHFWHTGFASSSMQQLVRATRVSRHGIYSEFGSKHKLFLSCLEFYTQHIVTPAFSCVEQAHAGLASIAEYFEKQIVLAEKMGLPGPGCFMANTSTEVGPHDKAVQNLIVAHNHRFCAGFENALANEFREASKDLELGKHKSEIREIAELLNSFAQGLWSLSRSTESVDKLRKLVDTQLMLVSSRLAG